MLTRCAALAAAALALAGCSGRRERAAPSPASAAVTIDASATIDADGALAMQLDPAKLAAADAARERTWAERERGVPARTVCLMPCPAPPPEAPDDRACSVRAPGVIARGTRAHLACAVDRVELDCCKPIATDDLPAVLTALGWDRADPAQRTAIAWLTERVIRGAHILDTRPDELPAATAFTTPAARADGDAVVLAYWALGLRGIRTFYARREVRYAADGTRTITRDDAVEPTPATLPRATP